MSQAATTVYPEGAVGVIVNLAWTCSISPQCTGLSRGLAQLIFEDLRIPEKARPKYVCADVRESQVRKTPSWPKSWANFSLF